MYIELVCFSCNNHFRIDFDDKEFSTCKCPICNAHISHTDKERIYSITEKLYTNIDKLNSVSIKTINMQKDNDEKYSKHKLNDYVFSNDIESLKELFNSSSFEVQEKIKTLVDTLYLLIYHDAKNEKIENLDIIEEKTKKYLLKKLRIKR